MKSKTTTRALAIATASLLFLTQSPAQVVTAFAGNSSSFGYGGDGGPATSTACLMHSPLQLAHDATGDIYFVDMNNYVVRKVSTAGTITTIAGNGSPLLSGVNPSGVPATSLTLGGLTGIAVDASGNVYFGEDAHVSKVTPSGTYYVYAGAGSTGGYAGDGGPATAALMNPTSLAFDPTGNLYVTEYANSVVRKINTTTGIISTVAGNGFAGFGGDGTPATTAMLNGPRDAKFDATGNMYIVDATNNRVRKVSTSGVISTFVNVTGAVGFAGDGGPAIAAYLNSPQCVAVDPATSDLFIADGLNQRIRRVSASTGKIMTYVGTGSWIWNGNGLIGTLTNIWGVAGVDVYSSNLYFSEQSNDDIRTISTISTAALMAPMMANAGDQPAMFPNPNNGSFTLTGTVPAGNTSVQVCVKDVTGRTVYTNDVAVTGDDLQARVDMPGGTPAGVYFLTASSPSFNAQLRFVKE